MIAILCIALVLFITIFLWCAIASSTQYDRDVSDEEQILFIRDYLKKQEI